MDFQNNSFEKNKPLVNKICPSKKDNEIFVNYMPVG